MAIKSNVGLSAIDIDTSDTVLIQPADPVQRLSVSAYSIHNTASTTIDVTLYESPNTTSASGTAIAEYSIAPLGSINVVEIIGQGYSQGRNIIGMASASGCNAVGTVTNYDGGS